MDKNQIEVDKNIETINQETIQIIKDTNIKIKEIINNLDNIDHVIIDNNNTKANIVSQDNIDKQTHMANKEIIVNKDSIDSKDNQDNIEVVVTKDMIIKDIKEIIIIITNNKDSKNKNMIIDFC